jgi:hypothetical protein
MHIGYKQEEICHSGLWIFGIGGRLQPLCQRLETAAENRGSSIYKPILAFCQCSYQSGCREKVNPLELMAIKELCQYICRGEVCQGCVQVERMLHGV